MMRAAIIALWAIALPVLALANDGALIFRRDVVTIMPEGYDGHVLLKDETDEPAEPVKLSKKLRKKMAQEEVIFDASKENVKKKKAAPPKPRVPAKINAEIRSDQALQLEWIASLNRLSSGEGVMIVFNPAVKMPLLEMNVLDPVDVLFVDAEGTIMQIAPELTLYGLKEEISAERPVRAWFFLKGGDVDKLRIEPGDKVQHPLFNPKALILH